MIIVIVMQQYRLILCSHIENMTKEALCEYRLFLQVFRVLFRGTCTSAAHELFLLLSQQHRALLGTCAGSRT